MPVDYQSPDYRNSLASVRLCRDAVSGSEAIKNGKTKYLPMLDPEDTSLANEKRYAQMLELALYTNFTGRTVEALNGAIYKREPVAELPSELEYMLTDCDGGDLSLTQFAKAISHELFQAGRVGVLVDVDSDQKAVFRMYKHESIINVTSDRIVLKQQYIKESDGFEHIYEDEYLVLRLDDAGYVQEVYRDDELFDVVEVRDYNGSRFDYIPFQFFGSRNNDKVIDKPPIFDMATVNIAHYRNSASVERSGWIMGEPMIYIAPGSNLPNDHFKENPIRFGVASGINVGDGGSAGILQASPNTLAQELQKEKVEQLIMLGARLVVSNAGNETATGALIRYGAENSVLSTIAQNTANGIEKCLRFAESFMIQNPSFESTFDIDFEFLTAQADANLLSVLNAMVTVGNLPKEELLRYAQKVGLIDAEADLSDLQESIEMASPLNGQQ